MKRGKLRRLCNSMLDLYTTHRIPMAAAGLSYFLTLSVFPMLICLYTMLGSMFPAQVEITHFLRGVLPADAIDIILDYLGYVSDHLSMSMLAMALAVLATSSSAAFRIIGRVSGDMWGYSRFSGFFSYVFSFCFSLIFLAAVYFSVLLTVTGKWFLEFADRHIMFMNISDSWQWGRFALLYLLLFVMLSGLYKLFAPRRAGLRLLPCAALASLALVAVSILFSAFIGASVKYPLVYGSLASIVIMMFWLYTCGVILFLGNALIVSLDRMK